MIINAQGLFKAKQELNQFLEENPHLKPIQQEIERHLSAAATPHNRMLVLARFMQTSSNLLIHHMEMLKVKIYQLQQLTKNFKPPQDVS